MTLSVGLVSGPVFSEGEDGEVLLASAMHIPTSSGKQMVQGKHLPKICFKAQLYEWRLSGWVSGHQSMRH